MQTAEDLFWILGAFFLVAVLNIAGCGFMLKGIGG